MRHVRAACAYIVCEMGRREKRSDKLEMLDITCADFDRARKRMSTPEEKTMIPASLKWSDATGMCH